MDNSEDRRSLSQFSRNVKFNASTDSYSWTSINQQPENDDLIHECTLKTSLDKFVDNKPKWIRNLLMSETSPETKKYFGSNYLIEQEIKRHVSGSYWYIIHPLSKFALCWNQIMFFVYIINWVVILFQISYHNELTSVSEIVNFAIQFPCYIDIVLTFFKGYVAVDDVILNQRVIASRYLSSWFITDLLTSIPFQVVKRWYANRLDLITLNIVILYQCLKVLTFKRIRKCFKHLWIAWQFKYVTYLILALVLFSLLGFTATSAVYQICANFEQMLHGNNTNPLNALNKFNPNPKIGKFWFKYLMCQYIVVMKYYCFTFTFFTYASSLPFESAVDVTIIFISYAYQLYAIVKAIQIYQYLRAPDLRYQEIMSQLERYMRMKRLPLKIKKNLVEFYEHRFQFCFFKERMIHENLSETLKREVIFHSGQIFIEKNIIFEGIPNSTINQIVACLKQEIYMPNDLIIKAGTHGDCMYFIATGTVSIVTLTGQELIHLSDGDHFGEISLFSKYGKRVTNIIAIEYCNLFRLSKSDYESIIGVIPELAQRFEALAFQRMNATSTFEELSKNMRLKKGRVSFGS